MNKVFLLTLLFSSVAVTRAQSDTADKTMRLRLLEEKKDSINTVIQSLTDARQPVAKISYESDWPMQTVTATLIDKRNGKPAAGVRCYLTVPGNNFELRTALADNDGVAKFLLQHVYSAKPMIFEIDQRKDSMCRFEVGDPFQGKKISVENERDSLAFFGTPDKRYMLDDYTRFPTLEEVLIEYVPEVKIKKNRGHYSMQTLNIPYRIFFEQEPIVLLDGVPVFNLDTFMSIDPLKIKKLEVMARRYYYGSAVWDGVVSFSSYDGDLAGYPLHDNAVVKEYKK